MSTCAQTRTTRPRPFIHCPPRHTPPTPHLWKDSISEVRMAQISTFLLFLVLTVMILSTANAHCVPAKPVYEYLPNNYGSWSIHNLPPGGSQIYDPNGPWNTPVPPNPKVDPNSPAMVNYLYSLPCCTGGKLGDWDWGHFGFSGNTVSFYDGMRPIYFSTASDPLFTIHCLRYDCGGLEGKQVRIPANARPAGGSDHHLGVIDQSTDTEYDFYGFGSDKNGNWLPLQDQGNGDRLAPTAAQSVITGNTIYCLGAGKAPVKGSGFGGGATASSSNLWGGEVRAAEWEWAAEHNTAIPHALAIQMACSNPDGIIYPPALGADSPCAPGTPAPHYGQRMWLDMTDAEIDALPGQAWQKVIYRTLAKYGAYYIDSNGDWGIIWFTESKQMYQSYGIPDPYIALGKKWGKTPDPPGPTGAIWLNWEIDGHEARPRLRWLHKCISDGTCCPNVTASTTKPPTTAATTTKAATTAPATTKATTTAPATTKATTTAPATTKATTAAPTGSSGAHSITLVVASDLADGIGAHFSVYLDGARIGSSSGYSVSIQFGQGWQTINLNADFRGGPHSLALKFDNDYDSPSGDQVNFYVRSATVDGFVYSGGDATTTETWNTEKNTYAVLYTNGQITFAITTIDIVVDTTAAATTVPPTTKATTAATTVPPATKATTVAPTTVPPTTKATTVAPTTVKATTVPPATTSASNTHSISLIVASDLADGIGAHFKVYVDNVLVGKATGYDVTVQLRQAWQTVTLSAGFAAGTHSLQLEFDNDYTSPTSGDQVNFYVQSATVDGVLYPGSDATTTETWNTQKNPYGTLYTNGRLTFTITVGGGSATTAPTTAPATGCTGSHSIYHNKRNTSWEIHNWGSSLTVGAVPTSPPATYVTKVLKVTPTATKGGLLFRTRSCPATKTYTNIRFWILPSAGRTWNFRMPVHACQNSVAWDSVPVLCNSTSATWKSAGGTWKRLTVSLNSTCLRKAGQLFSGFRIAFTVNNPTGASIQVATVQMTCDAATVVRDITDDGLTERSTNGSSDGVGGGVIAIVVASAVILVALVLAAIAAVILIRQKRQTATEQYHEQQ